MEINEDEIEKAIYEAYRFALKVGIVLGFICGVSTFYIINKLLEIL